MRKKSRDMRGFTTIEIIAVLIIMGIVAAIVLTRVTSPDTYDVASQAEIIKSHIRFVQTRSMNTDPAAGCTVAYGILMTGNSYFMFKDCDITNTVMLPGADGSSISLPAGMTVTAQVVTFDEWGKPFTDASGTAAPAGDIALTVSKGSSTETIIITKNTGFVP